ncbi:hypothetical protein [Marisediminicola sp. LYQ134]|uniref:hypothetical protein n=1 Tax=Marisediminicola sp. LYQ134 TaxID=3391061 RepID=UPI003983064F
MDETAASATLTASLEPRRGHPAAKAGRFLANVVGAAVFGSVDTVADTDLVVRRTSTGEVVLRTAADVGVPEHLLDEANKDLDELTEEGFLREWSATPDA